jgi:AcrR family transcriptional regulator
LLRQANWERWVSDVTDSRGNGGRNGDEPARSPIKERILTVAAELFARNGYDATGVAELGQAVGLGRGALYHHIESKEALLYEISTRHVVELLQYAEQLLTLELPAELRLRRLSRQLMRTIADNLPELTVFFHDFRSLAPERADNIAALRGRFDDAVAELLRQGVEEGAFRPMHPVATKGILGMHNYAYLWLSPGGELEPEEIADVFCDLLLHGIVPPMLRR